MRLITSAEREALLRECEDEAVHLEMRDSYAIDSEAERVRRFLATGQYDHTMPAPDRQRWQELVGGVTSTGRRVRRARIVSEPLSDYIRYSYAGTSVNIAAGEEIRWLPRRLTSGIALPGNDFWLFDGTTVVFNVFSGDGHIIERQLTTDAAAADLCRSAFEAVWPVAIPHDQYEPR